MKELIRFFIYICIFHCNSNYLLQRINCYLLKKLEYYSIPFFLIFVKTFLNVFSLEIEAPYFFISFFISKIFNIFLIKKNTILILFYLIFILIFLFKFFKISISNLFNKKLNEINIQ